MEKCGSQDEITIKLRAASAPDDVLVAAAKLGDRPAFTELWERHSQCAFSAAYRITKNRADAEDSIQDAWMKAYLHLERFDGRATFSTWVTRIAINSALMMLRKKRNHPETSLETGEGDDWRYWEIPDRSMDAETRLIARESREPFKARILPSKARFAKSCRDPRIEGRVAKRNRQPHRYHCFRNEVALDAGQKDFAKSLG
jgi:RNA polymerase sigma factor (sigma-70 family)